VARSLLIALAIASSALPAAASDIGTVKCGANQDRVWVYESLNSFDVETRLKCGETVEILARVRGYVKVRTASGVEGYVPDASFPDLPALPADDSDKPMSSVASRAAASAPGHTVAPMPPPPAATPIASSSPAAPPPSAKVSVAVPAPVVATQPSAAAKPATLVASKPAPAVATPARAKPHEKPVTPTVVAEPAPPKKAPARPAPATTQTAKSITTPPQPSAKAAMMVPAKADLTPASVAMFPTSANASPKADLDIREAERDPDLEEYPDAKPDNESADPACQVFFTAYGLAPAQYKWMVENRKKQHASICPAPDLAHVDFVILFAHDSDTYNSAMPSPVHTDRNGFSDFSPLTTVDTALQSMSELDKARYEFVWVFHTKRGTFDPAKFSARRRPLFTTDAKGSHAAGRAVDDAFQFIEGQGTPDR
jgi:Bacterial SH3 domain